MRNEPGAEPRPARIKRAGICPGTERPAEVRRLQSNRSEQFCRRLGGRARRPVWCGQNLYTKPADSLGLSWYVLK